MFLFPFVNDTNSGRRTDERIVQNKSRQLPIPKEYNSNVFGLLQEKFILKYSGKCSDPQDPDVCKEYSECNQVLDGTKLLPLKTYENVNKKISIGTMRHGQDKTEFIDGRPVTVTLSPPQIPCGLL